MSVYVPEKEAWAGPCRMLSLFSLRCNGKWNVQRVLHKKRPESRAFFGLMQRVSLSSGATLSCFAVSSAPPLQVALLRSPKEKIIVFPLRSEHLMDARKNAIIHHSSIPL